MGDCPVCLDKLGAVQAHTRCGHRFCRPCLERSVRESRGGPLCPACRAPIVTFAVVSGHGGEGASDGDEGGCVAVDEHVLVVPRGPSPDATAPRPEARPVATAPRRAQSSLGGRFTMTCSLIMLLYFLYMTVFALFPTTPGSVTYCQVGHALCSYQGDAPAALASTCSASIDQAAAETVFDSHASPVL